MHKPIFAAVNHPFARAGGENKTLAAAARLAMPANVQLLLSGHMHTFQSVSYVQDFPAQIVSGHGGDYIDPFAPQNFDGQMIDDMRVDQGRSVPATFGYALLEREAECWKLTGYDATGKAIAKCRLQGRQINCE